MFFACFTTSGLHLEKGLLGLAVWGLWLPGAAARFINFRGLEKKTTLGQMISGFVASWSPGVLECLLASFRKF